MTRRFGPLLLTMALASVALAQGGTPAPSAEKTPKDAPAKKKIARVATIELRLDGTEDPHAAMPFVDAKLNLRGFMKLVDRIAQDPTCNAVVLEPKGYGVGWARLLEVREGLKTLRRAGKKVFIYKETLGSADLVLASVADRISVPESGSVVLPGLAIESWYMKDMLAKLRVKFDVIHIGAYKSAGESMVRDSMSKEAKEALDPILDELYESMIAAIAEGRGIGKDAVKKAIDKGLLTAKEAQAAGLIDRVEYRDQFGDGVKSHCPGMSVKKWKDPLSKGKPKIDPNNPLAALGMVMNMLMTPEPKLPDGPKVAVIYCSGAIVSGESQYDWSGNVAAMGSKTIVKAIDKARKNKDVKAIVLRVNSPGGSALASDMIWRAVDRAKAVKPVIASMGDVAASGGYYISMNAHSIYAQPQTITGSIGVVGMIPNVDDVYPWIGIKPERLTRGKRSAALLTSKGLSDDDKEMIRGHMKAIYSDFVAKVAAGRGKTPSEIEPIAQGRVWTGRKAKEIGLVDKLGGLEAAIAEAAQRGGIGADKQEGEDWYVLEIPRRKSPFEMLDEMFGLRLGIEQAVLQKMPALRRVLRHLQTMQAVSKDKICLIHPELSGLLDAAR